jgi:hypothetical protein
MCTTPSPRAILENVPGETATMMNITNKTGIAATAVHMTMQIATIPRALRKRTFRQRMESRPGLSAIVVGMMDKCRGSVCTNSRTRAVRRVRTSRYRLTTTGFYVAHSRLQ